MSMWELTTAERYAEKTKLILQYQHFPAMTAAAEPFVTLSPHALKLAELPIYRKMLDRLEKEGNAGVQAAVAKARLKLPALEIEMTKLAAREAEWKRLNDEASRKPPSIPDWGRLKLAEKLARLDKHLAGGPLRPLRLKFAAPEDEWFLDNLRSVIAAGPGIDVFYAWGNLLPARAKDPPGTRPRPNYGSGKVGPVLLIMKEKGQLRRIWEKPGGPDKFSVVCFDGRYVWFALEGRRMAPELCLLDPAAEKVYEVNAVDSLPQPPEDLAKDPRRLDSLPLRLASLGQGRVCVAGGFGRGWVGVATFDPAKGKRL